MVHWEFPCLPPLLILHNDQIMILTLDDFVETTEFYRIPRPTGAYDTADLLGIISEGEKEFMETFELTEISGTAIEALKYYTFALWLRMQAARKTAAGAGAKINFTQSENHMDWVRRYQAYNMACEMMGRRDKKMLKILNC